MSNLAELAQAYEGRTAFAAAWTDDGDDGAAEAWAALRAVLDEGNVAGTTLGRKILFRADAGAPWWTISLDRYGRAIGVEVTPRYAFEARDEYGRWTRDAAGVQDESNYLPTREAAEAELPRLAEALGCDVDDLRVVEVPPVVYDRRPYHERRAETPCCPECGRADCYSLVCDEPGETTD